jgi:hypothetical protein
MANRGENALPEPTVQELSAQLSELRAELKPYIEASRTLPVVVEKTAASDGAKSPDARTLFEHRLATASVQDLPVLMKAKVGWDGLAQEEQRKKSDIQLRRMKAVAKIAMPIVGLATGLLLTFTGYPWVGSLALGAGLFGLAPTLIERAFDRLPGGGS